MADTLVPIYPRHGLYPSLALVIKHIIEVARALDRSLAKFTNVYSAATEILEIAEEIEDICGQHYTALDESDIAKNIIIGFLQDLKNIDADVRMLLSSNHKKTSAWMNSNKMESSLVEVKSRANTCLVQILMFTSANTNDQLMLIEHPNRHSLSVIQRQISSWVSDERIVAFLGVSSETLARLPPTVTTYHIADAYIRFQIDSINGHLETLSSSGSYAVEKRSPVYLAPYQLEIQTLIRNDPSIVSVQAGAWKMVSLCNVLDFLEMKQEAVSMGLWTVNLFRTLVSTDSKVYSPYLAYSLERLSNYYVRVKDYDAAEKAVQEAVVVDRRLYKQSKELEVQAQVVAALKTSAFVASLKKNNGKALEHAEEAVRLFELLIDTNRPPSLGDGPSHLHLLRTEQEWAEALANFPDQANLSYARALQQLSFSQHDNGRAVDAVGPQVKATTIMKYMSRYFPDGGLDPELARMLYRLSHRQFHNFMSLEEALDYSN
ncbi:hypothetical protein CPB84DRAFT_1851987 [Gymnopilus junonius]|uniref:Uncharacterized protein n=1 Tax=Gymnopilus junonius TaxID=109634 RepID=A0A9P5THY7_GYMJU|nr:hypothetical protein CPB84DRAFT_1851987 [Gymnopilus junonius]